MAKVEFDPLCSALDPLALYFSKTNFTDTNLINAVIDFYYALVSNDLFDKLELCYPMVTDKTVSADCLVQHSFNLVNANNYRLTYYNTPVADKIGIQWNSVNKSYANTGYVPLMHHTTMTLSQACGGVYQTTNAGNSVDFGSNNTIGNYGSFAMSSNLGTDMYDAINSPIQFSTTPDSTIGQNTMIRDGSFSQFTTRRNGATTKTFAFANVGVWCDLPLLIGALGPITNNLWSNNKVNHMFVASFTIAELIIYEGLVNTFQGAVDTALSLGVGARKKY